MQARIDAAERLTDLDPSTDSTPARKEGLKVLGITWNTNSDSLVFDLSGLSIATDNLQPSKRNLVSLIGRFYDPLGFLAPIAIKFKILLQKFASQNWIGTAT